jgi:hypothetical protein
MAKEARKQVGLNMRATLYDDLAKLAKDNGQTESSFSSWPSRCRPAFTRPSLKRSKLTACSSRNSADLAVFVIRDYYS